MEINKYGRRIYRFGRKIASMLGGSHPKDNVISNAVDLSIVKTLSALQSSQNNILGVVFSMDRAMQLHALLGSYVDNVHNRAKLSILYRATTEAHEIAYQEVFDEYQSVIETIIKQDIRQSFRPHLNNILQSSSAEYLFFLVDDDLFIEKFDLVNFANLTTFYSVPSMRMGLNLSKSYVVQKVQPLPAIVPFVSGNTIADSKDELTCWRWCNGELDWGYPLSVDGHLFLRKEIMAFAANTEFDSPNTFEGNMQQHLPQFSNRFGIGYEKSRMVNIPYNRVQNDVENIHANVHQDYMLEKWQAGYRINRNSYYGMANESVHQEMPLNLLQTGGK